MPRFEVEQGGKRYEVEAASPEAALEAVQSMQGGGLAAAAGATSPQEAPFTVGGMAKSIGSGAVRGLSALAGMKGDLDTLVGAGLDRILPPAAESPSPLSPTSREVLGAVEQNVTGPLYQGKNTLEKYGGTIGEFLPNAVGGLAGLPRRLATRTVAPAVGSEAAGQATEGTALEPYARLGGAMAGGAAPTLARRAITPFPITPERQKMVDTLRGAGVNPTAGQVTGRDRLKAFEQELGGHTFQGQQERISEEFTQAVLKKAGVNAKRATPEVVNDAFTRIGADFDALAARTAVPIDRQLQTDLIDVVMDYRATTGAVAPGVEQMVRRIAQVAGQNGGVLQGRAYQNIRSKMGEWIKKADGPTQMAFRDLQEALDDAVERHMSLGDRQAWREARRQYRNLLVVERAVTGAGADVAMGGIPPHLLRQASVGQNRRAYARGRHEYSDLGHSGQALLNTPPRSGTPERLAVRGVPAGISATVGGAIGGTLDPTMVLPGAIGGAALPYLMGKGVMSKPMQGYLGNQLLPTQPYDATRQALVQGLLYGPRLLGPPPAQP